VEKGEASVRGRREGGDNLEITVGENLEILRGDGSGEGLGRALWHISPLMDEMLGQSECADEHDADAVTNSMHALLACMRP
jgi:hypothetical protein